MREQETNRDRAASGCGEVPLHGAGSGGGERGSRVKIRAWREICRVRRRGSARLPLALSVSACAPHSLLVSFLGRRVGGAGGRTRSGEEEELCRCPSRLAIWQLGHWEGGGLAAWVGSAPPNCPGPHGRPRRFALGTLVRAPKEKVVTVLE